MRTHTKIVLAVFALVLGILMFTLPYFLYSNYISEVIGEVQKISESGYLIIYGKGEGNVSLSIKLLKLKVHGIFRDFYIESLWRLEGNTSTLKRIIGKSNDIVITSLVSGTYYKVTLNYPETIYERTQQFMTLQVMKKIPVRDCNLLTRRVRVLDLFDVHLVTPFMKCDVELIFTNFSGLLHYVRQVNLEINVDSTNGWLGFNYNGIMSRNVTTILLHIYKSIQNDPYTSLLLIMVFLLFISLAIVASVSRKEEIPPLIIQLPLILVGIMSLLTVLIHELPLSQVGLYVHTFIIPSLMSITILFIAYSCKKINIIEFSTFSDFVASAAIALAIIWSVSFFPQAIPWFSIPPLSFISMFLIIIGVIYTLEYYCKRYKYYRQFYGSLLGCRRALKRLCRSIKV